MTFSFEKKYDKIKKKRKQNVAQCFLEQILVV